MYNRRRSFRSGPPRSHRGNSGMRRKSAVLDASLFVKQATATQSQQYTPRYAFTDFPFGEQLRRNIVQHGFTQPTPIQDQAIPLILERRDVIGIANTGTGKTAAFLLPLLHRIQQARDQRVLIVAPTRELAGQIEDECRAFSRYTGIYSVLVIGGVGMGQQIAALRRNPQVVIGTPGRLKDLERQGVIRFPEFGTVVLDEVDRMLDMGFIHDIQYIFGKLPSSRHTLFFSATVPPAVREMMDTLLTDPVTVSVKTQESSDRVNQEVIKTNGKPKIELLHDLLIQEGFEKVLLFGRTKWGIEKLSRQLENRGFKVAAIHGNKRQSQRQRALDEFKQNRIQVLLATDIASRGIDVPDVTHVINYDAPESYEDYIHRIGRTGRAEKFGTALTFID